MPNIKSQAKRVRQDEKRRLRNKAIKSNLKSLTAQFEKSLQEKDIEASENLIKQVIRATDKAASKGTLHKKRAAGKKSKLVKQMSKTDFKKTKKSTKES